MYDRTFNCVSTWLVSQTTSLCRAFSTKWAQCPTCKGGQPSDSHRPPYRRQNRTGHGYSKKVQQGSSQAAKQLTISITSQRNQALQHIRLVSTDPIHLTDIVEEHCKQTLDISSSPAINPIHCSAMISSTAKVFAASHAILGPSQAQQQQCHQLAKQCVTNLLHKLEKVLPELRAQAGSNILWSCAKLDLNPDSAVPGLTVSLLSTVAEDEFAVAQNLSNAVWAVATLKDATQLAPADMAVVTAICMRLVTIVDSPLTETSVIGQDVSNLLWAAATLDLRLEALVLDKLCAYLVQLTQQASVDAQCVANALWSFFKMRHSPEPAHLSSLLAYFQDLLAVPGRQPSSQNISNVVLAMAGLGHQQSNHVVKNLAHRLLVVKRANLAPQALCNVVWSLAVLGVLDIATFKLFWSIVLERFHGKVSASEARQLYQALYKLQPPSHDLTWQQVRQAISDVLGPMRLVPSQQSPALHAVLQTLQLEHSQDVPFSVYTAEAVLRQRGGEVRKILLVTLNADDHLTNIPSRLTGPARFRLGILARHGNLVVVPHDDITVARVKKELQAFVFLANSPGQDTKAVA